jgi:hypothetical protein
MYVHVVILLPARVQSRLGSPHDDDGVATDAHARKVLADEENNTKFVGTTEGLRCSASNTFDVPCRDAPNKGLPALTPNFFIGIDRSSSC